MGSVYNLFLRKARRRLQQAAISLNGVNPVAHNGTPFPTFLLVLAGRKTYHDGITSDTILMMGSITYLKQA